jgi:hypothetical protein
MTLSLPERLAMLMPPSVFAISPSPDLPVRLLRAYDDIIKPGMTVWDGFCGRLRRWGDAARTSD